MKFIWDVWMSLLNFDALRHVNKRQAETIHANRVSIAALTVRADNAERECRLLEVENERLRLRLARGSHPSRWTEGDKP